MSRRSSLRLALLGCLSSVVLSCSAAVARGEVGIGDALPDLTLPDWHGGEIRLADVHADVVVVEFWASWCAPCKEALPAMNGLAMRYGARLQVLAINIDSDRTTAERFLAALLPNPRVTVLSDPGGAAMARFGAPGMPSIYIIERGIVRRIETGFNPTQRVAVEGTIEGLVGTK